MSLKEAAPPSSERRVTFGKVSCIHYEWSLTADEKDLCWHRPEDLKRRTRDEIQLARRCFKTHTKPPANFVVRGLEKRLQSSDAQKRKWYSFLQSFLALQHDLQKLEGDISSLLAVFVSTHSKTHLLNARQVARQDQAVANAIYRTRNTTGSTGELSKLSNSNSKNNLRSQQPKKMGHARTA